MGKIKLKVCSNCVMDSSDSNINFDENGVCDHCNIFKKVIFPLWQKKIENNNKTEEIINNIKNVGKGKDFDCIIGMSGGIDSSYLVYLAKEVFGLRPLVFHVDGGWNSQEAANNIEKITDKLNLDLYTEVINWNEMRDLQLSYFKSGVPHIDTPQDHAFFATMYKFANKNNIKYILTGGNYSTECIRNPLEWMYFQSDSTQLLDIHHKFGTVPLKTFPITSVLKHKLYMPYIRGIKTLRLLDNIEYNKSSAIKFLVKKFNWQPYAQKHFESIFTKFYEGYWLPERFGFDTRKVQFSSLILTGQMSRKEAIKELQNLPYNKKTIKSEYEYVANKLDIKIDQLDEYFYISKKSFKDYKSQSNLYYWGSKVSKLLKLELGGKR